MNAWDGRRKLYHDRRVVVIGASGFIGRWVARSLCRLGAELHLVVRDRGQAQIVFSKYGVPGTIHEQDLLDVTAVHRLLQVIRPSVTFNLAAYGVDPAERDENVSYRINTALVRTIGKAIAEVRDPRWSGQDLIHVGTALEYGAACGHLAEDTVPIPTTVYGKSKLAGTKLLAECCRQDGIKALTARLFTVYGPGEHPGRLLPSLLDAAASGRPVALTTGEQRRDFTYVEDVADGLLRLGVTTTSPGTVVNLATGQLTSVREFVVCAAKVLGIPDAQLQFGMLPTRREEMDHQEVITECLKRIADWIPRTGIAEGIRRTAACLQEPNRERGL